MRFLLLIAFCAVAIPAFAQTDVPAPVVPKPAELSSTNSAASAKPGRSHSPTTTAQLQAALDQLTQDNRALRDLLKQQQAVLEDIEFDRRQQSRHIESLEERLEAAHLENVQLQNKIGNLETAAAVPPSSIPGFTPIPAVTNSASANPAPAPIVAPPPPPPSTYLPPPETEGAPGTKSWHRLFTLKGEEGRKTDLFPIQGRTWRVLWHNLDAPGKAHKNTSALFINAFPKDDTIPQKVCAKLGSGGDSTELDGPGNFYLKIEASGGSWELAVEDFR